MYYSGNRILTEEEMKVNAQFIYEFLTPRGWTKNSICGMLGNMQTESTINPAIWENLTIDINRGYGLVQWTPATKYIDWCNTVGLIPEAMESNLLRILYEVENNIQWSNPTMTFYEFTQSTLSPYDLGMLFLEHYEKPLDPNQPTRGAQAEQWFNILNGTTSHSKKKSKVFLFTKKRRVIM
jgi:hypothetical protein